MSRIECLSRAEEQNEVGHVADGRVSGVFTTTRRGMEIPAASVSSRKEVAKKHAQPDKFLASLDRLVHLTTSRGEEIQWLVSGKTESLFLGSCILSWAFGRIEDRVAKRIDVSTLLLILLLILAEFIGIISSNVVLDKSDLGGLSTKHYGGVDRSREDDGDGSKIVSMLR
jgi:hypothetical protein